MIFPLVWKQYKKNALVCQQYITAKFGLISIFDSFRLLKYYRKEAISIFNFRIGLFMTEKNRKSG